LDNKQDSGGYDGQTSLGLASLMPRTGWLLRLVLIYSTEMLIQKHDYSSSSLCSKLSRNSFSEALVSRCALGIAFSEAEVPLES